MAVQNVNKGFVYTTDFTASLKIKPFDRKFFADALPIGQE